MRLLLAWLVLLVLVNPAWQTITIDLSGANVTLDDYTDEDLFTSRYANVANNKIEGYVWKWEDGSFPNNACLYIDPLPASVKINQSKWFALVSDFLDCPESMVDNVRNAGFDLIIAYTNGTSSIHNVPKSLSNRQFPIVVISDDYAQKLWDSASSDSLTDAVLAKVVVANDDIILMAAAAVTFFVFLSLTVCIFCMCYVRLRNRRGVYRVNRGLPGDNMFHERYAQARMARQDLIESILRQLQELQGAEQEHVPLGETETRALPQKPFVQVRRESSTKDTCAICVEEFQEDDTTRVLPCKHFFHPDCIDPWLISHSSVCPLCKQSVRPSETRQQRQPLGGARPRILLEVTTEEDDDTSSTGSFGTPILALNDIADTPSPDPPANANAAVNARAADSISVSSLSSDTPLMVHSSHTSYTSA